MLKLPSTSSPVCLPQTFYHLHTQKKSPLAHLYNAGCGDDNDDKFIPIPNPTEEEVLEETIGAD
jgi:hypothetical protein